MKPQMTSDFRIFAGLLLLALILGICSGQAQSTQRITHLGFETSMGLYGYGLQVCDAGKVEARVLSRGAVAGMVFGNNLFTTRLRLAGFQSTEYVKNSFGVEQAQLLMNVYPLEFLRTRKNVLDISMTLGLAMSRFRFDDHADEVQGTPGPYSPVTASQVIGMGIEYRFPSSRRPVHLFCEALFSSQFYSSEQVNINGASFTTFGSMNFGVRLGTMLKRKA